MGRYSFFADHLFLELAWAAFRMHFIRAVRFFAPFFWPRSQHLWRVVSTLFWSRFHAHQPSGPRRWEAPPGVVVPLGRLGCHGGAPWLSVWHPPVGVWLGNYAGRIVAPKKTGLVFRFFSLRLVPLASVGCCCCLCAFPLADLFLAQSIVKEERKGKKKRKE